MTELLNEIGDSIGFGSDEPAWNEKYKYITNDPPNNDGAWRKSLGYGFRVVEVKSGFVLEATEWQPFLLQINPQNLSQDEIFAINVTPTFRGVVVEHQGTILKDITISGTTGNSPKRVGGGALSDSGAPILNKGRSGYREFHDLRSYFRAYVEEKRVSNVNDGYELRLVFDNFKDHEHIFVEPQKFTLKRDATRAFLYNYNIQLKGIGNATAPISEEPTSLESLFDAIDSINDALNDVTNFIDGSVDLLNRIERGIETSLLEPLKKFGDAIDGIRNGAVVFNSFGESFKTKFKAINDDILDTPTSTDSTINGSSISADEGAISQSTASNNTSTGTLIDYNIDKTFLEDFSSEVLRISNNFSESIGIDLTQYNSAVDRTESTTSQSVTMTFDEHQMSRSLTLLRKTINKTLSKQELFFDDVKSENSKVAATYDNEINLFTPGTTRVAYILGGDTIQIVASRELNNVDRYRELVILNNLVPPYIDITPSNGVLTTGNTILIPQNKIGDDLGIRQGKDYNVTAGLTEAEKALGVDLRLNKNFDIAFNNVGDFDVHAGIEVYVQAIVLRLKTEIKSLKRHSGYGTDLKIGGKLTTRAVSTLRSNILLSLQSDVRTESVDYLSVKVDNSEVSILALLKPVKINQTVPIPIKTNI